MDFNYKLIESEAKDVEDDVEMKKITLIDPLFYKKSWRKKIVD